MDRIYDIEYWDKNTIYVPDRPITFPETPSMNMDYRKYSDKYINKELYLRDFHDIKFQCLINTCNYFLPCKEYVNCMDENFNIYNRNIIDCLDSAVLFTDWLVKKNKIKVLKNLFYYHRLHSNSNYMNGRSRNYEGKVIYEYKKFVILNIKYYKWKNWEQIMVDGLFQNKYNYQKIVLYIVWELEKIFLSIY